MLCCKINQIVVRQFKAHSPLETEISTFPTVKYLRLIIIMFILSSQPDCHIRTRIDYEPSILCESNLIGSQNRNIHINRTHFPSTVLIASRCEHQSRLERPTFIEFIIHARPQRKSRQGFHIPLSHVAEIQTQLHIPSPLGETHNFTSHLHWEKPTKATIAKTHVNNSFLIAVKCFPGGLP